MFTFSRFPTPAANPRSALRDRHCDPPIAVGKIGRDMPGVAAEFEYVPLREADVLQQLPGGVLQPIRVNSAFFCGKIRQSIGDSDVCFAALQQFNKTFPKRSVRFWTLPHCLSTICPFCLCFARHYALSETTTC